MVMSKEPSCEERFRCRTPKDAVFIAMPRSTAMMGISPLWLCALHSGGFGPVYLPFTQLNELMPILGTPGQAKELWLEMWFGTKFGSLKVKNL